MNRLKVTNHLLKSNRYLSMYFKHILVQLIFIKSFAMYFELQSIYWLNILLLRNTNINKFECCKLLYYIPMHVEGIISLCNTIMTFIAFSALRKLPSNPILFSKTAMENLLPKPKQTIQYVIETFQKVNIASSDKKSRRYIVWSLTYIL